MACAWQAETQALVEPPAPMTFIGAGEAADSMPGSAETVLSPFDPACNVHPTSTVSGSLVKGAPGALGHGHAATPMLEIPSGLDEIEQYTRAQQYTTRQASDAPDRSPTGAAGVVHEDGEQWDSLMHRGPRSGSTPTNSDLQSWLQGACARPGA